MSEIDFHFGPFKTFSSFLIVLIITFSSVPKGRFAEKVGAAERVVDLQHFLFCCEDDLEDRGSVLEVPKQ